MQTSFYSSGFLYSLKTRQILLLQPRPKNDLPSQWSMIGGEGMEGEEALEVFQRIIFKRLSLNLKAKQIYSVYDYFHSAKNKPAFVFYAEVGKNITAINSSGIFTWFSFSETSKLNSTDQTKRDIMVGERVINAKIRDLEASKLLPQAGVS